MHGSVASNAGQVGCAATGKKYVELSPLTVYCVGVVADSGHSKTVIVVWVLTAPKNIRLVAPDTGVIVK